MERNNSKEFGSEFDWEANKNYLNGKTADFIAAAKMYRSGRDAIKEIASFCRVKCDKVLLPALSCDSVVRPFLQYGYNVIFYKLNNDFTADISDIGSKFSEGTVLFYLNYFGIPSIGEESLICLREKRNNVFFVEDRTHDVFVKRSGSRFKPDFTVLSIRKWVAVPEGGLLLTDFVLPHRKGEKAFADMRMSAFINKTEYIKTQNEDLKTEYRKQFAEANDLLDSDNYPYSITDMSKNLLESIDFNKVYMRRQSNAKKLDDCLQGALLSNKIKSVTCEPWLSTLYYPVLVEDRDVVQKRAAALGVFCPVIWPLVAEAEGVCRVSDYIAQHILCIPCDQRYNEEDMQLIADKFLSVL